MTDPQTVRDEVSRNYAAALERPVQVARPCCAGPVPKGVAANLAGYSHESLAVLPEDAVVHSFGCGPAAPSGEQVGAALDAMAGKVASIRVAGRKPMGT